MDLRREVFDGVLGDAEEAWPPTEGAHEGGDAVRVRVIDLSRPALPAGRHDLVAGREDRDLGPAIHGDLREADAREHAHLRGAHGASRVEDDLACGDILRLRADVRGDLGGLEDGHDIAARRRLTRRAQWLVGLLEGHDRVRPGRYRCARHDAHGLALADLRVEHVARSEVRDDLQAAGALLGRAGRVRCAHGVAVHGGVVEGWDVERGGDVFGHHLAERVEGGHRCGLEPGEEGEDARARVLDADHRGGWDRHVSEAFGP